MAHLWVDDDAGGWVVVSLDRARVDLDTLADGARARVRDTASPTPTRAIIASHDDARGRSVWQVIATRDADIRINGLPLLAGLHVMSDRDEIRLPDGCACFFSTETLAAVQPMPDRRTPMVCPRCRQPIDAGTPAVRCPQCAIWHHQSDALPCWTYGSTTCTLCPQPSALDAGFQWTPVAL